MLQPLSKLTSHSGYGQITSTGYYDISTITGNTVSFIGNKTRN